jgi:uncharacterized protein (TIGR00297 family)
MMFLRKLIHLLMGFFTLALKYISPPFALICAGVAFLHNLYIFPLYGRRKIEKKEEKERKYYAIVSYPVVVFLLLLFAIYIKSPTKGFQMAVAGSAWAILAFGDSTSAIFGSLFKGVKLSYNKDKTIIGVISFILFGFVSSFFVFLFITEKSFLDALRSDLFIALLIAVIVSALVESLSGQFDDNIGFPFVALSIISFASLNPSSGFFNSLYISNLDRKSFKIFIFIMTFNLFFALISYLKKWIDIRGSIFGFLIGCGVIVSTGFKGYIVLLLFFIFANCSTCYGRKVKRLRGIEESNEGKRGIESVFSKGVAPLVLSFFSFEAFVLTLSFYASDTVATEFGKTTKGKTFSLLNFKQVNPGFVGGVSLKGTLSGMISILIFNYISLFIIKGDSVNLPIYLSCSIIVIIFFIMESILNELNQKCPVTSKWVIHIVSGFLLGFFVNQTILRISN